METLNKKVELEHINQNKKIFLEEQVITNRILLKEAKNLIMKGRTAKRTEELKMDGYTKKIEYNPSLNQQKFLDSQNHRMLLDIFRFVTEDVCHLSPEKLDALWSTDVLTSMQLWHVKDKIMATADKNTLKAALFDDKKVCLMEVWPEYYAATYGEGYDILEVLDAKDSTLRNINTYGRSKSSIITGISGDDPDAKNKKRNYHSPNYGGYVDELIVEALEAFFELKGANTIPEKLEIAADAKKVRLTKLGVKRILTARGCYPSFLDFYYLNGLTPAEQVENMRTYYVLRKRSQKADNFSIILETCVKNGKESLIDLAKNLDQTRDELTIDR